MVVLEIYITTWFSGKMIHGYQFVPYPSRIHNSLHFYAYHLVFVYIITKLYADISC